MHMIDYRYLRPKKAAWLERMFRTPFPCREKLQVWQGENAVIFPRRIGNRAPYANGQGGVLDKDGSFVELSANPGRIGGVYPLETPEVREETVVFCGYLYQHWGHFLVESTARLWYFLKKDPAVDKYIFFLDENENRAIDGNFREFLELLGIWDKAEFITRPVRYRQVIVPEPAYLCMQYWSEEFISVFDAAARNVVPDPAWEMPETIFFTRSHFAKDSGYEFGMDALDHFFRKNGFAVLAPERMSLSQMIFTIRNAKTVATISGTLPHNMLFANPGQKLVILERLVINVDHQVCVDQMRGLDVVRIDANYPIYTIDTHGPYMVGCNHLLIRFAQENDLLPPDAYYTSDACRDKCFKQYMHAYQDNYRYRWHKESWYPEIADSLWEAYEDSYGYFKDFLDGNRPFLREHYFQIHYWKQFIKRILRK